MSGTSLKPDIDNSEVLDACEAGVVKQSTTAGVAFLLRVLAKSIAMGSTRIGFQKAFQSACHINSVPNLLINPPY